MLNKLKLFTDGGSRGNPGPAAYGFVLYSSSSQGAAIILEKCGNYLGSATNNQAEYEGLLAGLRYVNTNYPQLHLEIYMDSLLIVNQVKGLYRVKNPTLKPLYQQVAAQLNSLSSYTISHVTRDKNAAADAMVNEALDSALA